MSFSPWRTNARCLVHPPRPKCRSPFSLRCRGKVFAFDLDRARYAADRPRRSKNCPSNDSNRVYTTGFVQSHDHDEARERSESKNCAHRYPSAELERCSAEHEADCHGEDQPGDQSLHPAKGGGFGHKLQAGRSPASKSSDRSVSCVRRSASAATGGRGIRLAAAVETVQQKN